MATTARRTTRKTPIRSVAVSPTGDLQPLRFTTPEIEPEIERIVAFYIDDTPYSIPAEVSPSVSLRFMRASRAIGMEMAMGDLLGEMLGEEAYAALADYKHLTQQNMADLFNLVRKHAMGAMEVPKGSSRSA